MIQHNVRSIQQNGFSMLSLDWLLVSGTWTTTLLVGLGTGLLAYWLIQKYKYKYPPGPWCPPLIGHLLQLNVGNICYEMQKWSERYGPVVTVYLGPVPMVYVNKIGPAMDVLVKRSTNFANRLQLPSILALTYGGKDIIFGNYTPTWKLHRRIASKALRHYMLGSALEHRVHTALETAMAELDKRLDGVPFDNSEYINFIVGNILTGLCFGGKYSFDDKEVTYILEKEDEIFANSNGTLEDVVPLLRYVYKTKVFKELEDFTDDVFDNFLGKRLKEAQGTFDRDNIRHFTDNLILARLEAEEEEGAEVLTSLTDKHILQTLGDIFFAGIDTSRLTLRFAILHMMMYPDIQTKVQEEIDQAVGKDRLPGMEDRPLLPYTEAVLHESMRLATVLPSGVMHCTTCDTEIGGYTIPKNTCVTINHWALHHDPEAWVDPAKFCPERFLDDDGKLSPKPTNWLPFSAGKRVCLGEFVAKPELHLLFAGLMQRYRWRPESGKPVDPGVISNILVRIPKPYKCVIENRI